MNLLRKNTFQSAKVFDGFSTCFRQWRADTTHCMYLHAYNTHFKVWFEGELDERNWTLDFGIGSRSVNLIDGMTLKDWLKWLLDHTVVVAEDDPALEWFKEGERMGIVRLRILPNVGTERFAEYLFNKMNPFIQAETESRVKIVKIEFSENENNSAIYINNN